MIELLTLNKILVLLINVTAVWIGFSVFKNNPKEKINRVIILMTVSMLFWVDFAYLARMVGEANKDLSLIFLKIAWFVTPLFFTLLYFLVIYLLQKEKKYSFLSKVIGFLGILSTLATGFTNLVIERVAFVKNSLTIVYGKGMLPFLAIVLFIMFATLYPLFKEYRKLSRNQKRKIQYFSIGIFIFYLANMIFNITFPLFFKITRWYWIGDYSAIFLLGFTTYAIVKEKLFGLRVIFTQLLVGVIAILLLVNFTTAESAFSYFWKGLLFAAFIVFGAFLVKSVKREIEQKEERDKYAAQLATANVKLEKAYARLKKLDKAKSEFISIASHQLRTPLTAIKGYISMLLEGDYGKLNKKSEKAIDNVFQSNERIIKLVNSLLNLSRIESGKIKLVKKTFSLENMISNLINVFQNQARKKGLNLSFKTKGKIPEIKADQQKIEEVVSNLIDNAIKYTRKGEIIVSLEKNKRKILLSVKDTGEGMTKEDISKLFQSFSRAEAGSKMYTQGAGLGLYIAKQFIQMHKGKIWAESEGKGKGSIFFIDLPIK